jgi:RNA polymerase sigma-70 factor (ECF subfamily)
MRFARLSPSPGLPHTGDRLIDRCRAGERAAQRELFDLHLERVRRILVRLLGHHPDLDDLTQTVFVECFRSLDTFRGEALFTTWLSRICVRVAQRRFGDRAARQELALVEELEPLHAADSDAEAQLVRRDLLKRLAVLIEALPPKPRVAYVLHVLEGHTLKETAAILSRSVPLVVLRVRAAQRALQEKLEQDPDLGALLKERTP